MPPLTLETVSEQEITVDRLGEAEFVRFYEDNRQRVVNYLCYRIGPEEAEDLTAQVFARVWAGRLSYDARRGALSTWVWAIVRNAVKDHLRQKQRRPLLVRLLPGLAGARGPQDDAAQNEEWRQLRAALSELQPVDQEIIALRFGGGHTNRAIAALVDLSEANVAQRLRRALRKLREALEGKVGL